MTLPRLFSILLAAAVPWLVIGVRTGASGRVFPDVFTRVGVLTDQLPNAMTDAQVRFAATHFVGSQKLTPDTSGRLRAVNPDFIVLHYRLAMWQSAVNYLADGRTWSNDLPFVTQHEDWFWHNPAGQRVTSEQDGKLLMNVANEIGMLHRPAGERSPLRHKATPEKFRAHRAVERTAGG